MREVVRYSYGALAGAVGGIQRVDGAKALCTCVSHFTALGNHSRWSFQTLPIYVRVCAISVCAVGRLPRARPAPGAIRQQTYGFTKSVEPCKVKSSRPTRQHGASSPPHIQPVLFSHDTSEANAQ